MDRRWWGWLRRLSGGSRRCSGKGLLERKCRKDILTKNSGGGLDHSLLFFHPHKRNKFSSSSSSSFIHEQKKQTKPQMWKLNANNIIKFKFKFKPIFLAAFALSFFFFFYFLLRPAFNNNNHQSFSSPSTTTTTTGIRIRPGYNSYDEYIAKQLNKTLDPRLRKVWTTRDWDRKVRVFSSFFSDLITQDLLSNSSRALCIGARVGQEVAALRGIGVSDAVGIDLVPFPPLVVKGDFHNQPFADETFDFEFSNVFDHALYPEKFVGEVERTLKPGGVCVLHVALKRRGDKYSANDLLSFDGLVKLFRFSLLVRVTTIDGFGLDTQVVFTKKKRYR